MATDPMFGWDLVFKSIEQDIKRKPDVVIAFVHFNLVKRGFRCIGIGEERTITGEEEGSEVLPSGWNLKDNYTIKYIYSGKLFILHGLCPDNNIILNLMRSEDLAVSNIAVNTMEMVKELKGPLVKLMPEYKTFMFNVKRDLIDAVTERTTTTAETQTQPLRNYTQQDRSSVNDPLAVRPVNPPNWNNRIDPADPFNVGRSDLEPFGPGPAGAGGGGMLFQPFAPRSDLENPGLGIPGRIPRGSVPPGARFDPFGPPGGLPRPNARQPPDADHLPPPGPDMFM